MSSALARSVTSPQRLELSTLAAAGVAIYVIGLCSGKLWRTHSARQIAQSVERMPLGLLA